MFKIAFSVQISLWQSDLCNRMSLHTGARSFLCSLRYSNLPFIRVCMLSPLEPCDWAASSQALGHFWN